MHERARARAGRAASPRPSGSTQRDDPRPVAEQHLEPDLVEQLADAVHDLAGSTAARPASSTSAYAGPARAASSIASQISATASGWLSRTPAARRRRASSAAANSWSRSSSHGIRRIRDGSGGNRPGTGGVGEPMRRWMVGILALVTLSGCAPTGQGAGAPGAPDDIELAAATVPRLASNPEDASNAGSAVNAFGLDLYRQVAAQDASANLVLSPASIALALAMARAGARGQTASEMDAVLHGLGTDEHAAWPAALDAALPPARVPSRMDRRALRRHPADRERALRPARMPFEPAYLDALGARFGAGLRLVDYKHAPEPARALINGWVADQTEQRIPQLLRRGRSTTGRAWRS